MILSELELMHGLAGDQLSLTLGHASYCGVAQKLSNRLLKERPDLSLSTGVGELTTVGLYQAV